MVCTRLTKHMDPHYCPTWYTRDFTAANVVAPMLSTQPKFLCWTDVNVRFCGFWLNATTMQTRFCEKEQGQLSI